mmetsp:Transcript_10166/g.22864  ORF Transcript_10166/g.22864 Transcript_10166/m.22864 type:complete len:202 (+) Transcript_10166:2011-2616(+)
MRPSAQPTAPLPSPAPQAEDLPSRAQIQGCARGRRCHGAAARCSRRQTSLNYRHNGHGGTLRGPSSRAGTASLSMWPQRILAHRRSGPPHSAHWDYCSSQRRGPPWNSLFPSSPCRSSRGQHCNDRGLSTGLDSLRPPSGDHRCHHRAVRGVHPLPPPETPSLAGAMAPASARRSSRKLRRPNFRGTHRCRCCRSRARRSL